MTADEFKSARARLGFTQAEAALAIGMGAYGWQTISKWENGRAAIPGWALVSLDLMAQVRELRAALENMKR